MIDLVSMPSVIPNGIVIIRSLNSSPAISPILSTVFISVSESFKVLVSVEMIHFEASMHQPIRSRLASRPYDSQS